MVEKDGSISNIKASGNNDSFNNEAVYAVSLIQEKWIPAEINGEKVRYRFRVPLDITFEDAYEPATFPHGIEAFKKIIFDNLHNQNFKDKGNCSISFVVENTGLISNISVRGNNKKLNKEVKKNISNIKTP